MAIEYVGLLFHCSILMIDIQGVEDTNPGMGEPYLN